MWTHEGRTKSVHNSKVSTLVKLGVAIGHTMAYHVHVEKYVSTGVDCPKRRGVHKVGSPIIDLQQFFYSYTNQQMASHEKQMDSKAQPDG